MSSLAGLGIPASESGSFHPARCLFQEQHPLMQNIGRSDLLSDKEQLQGLLALCYPMVSGDRGACRLPESGGRNVMPPTLASWVCHADGPVANGDAAVDALLLALADISMGILYSIFGFYPYADPPIYLSTGREMKHKTVGQPILF